MNSRLAKREGFDTTTTRKQRAADHDFDKVMREAAAINLRDYGASSSTGKGEVTTHRVENPPTSPEPPDVPTTELRLRPRRCGCGCASIAAGRPSIVGPVLSTAQPLQLGHPQADDEHLIVTEDDEEIHAAVEEWQDSVIEIILDSGACRHVMARESAPGYAVHESPGSRRGQNFVVGNGERVPNEGQMALSLQVDGRRSHLIPGHHVSSG